MPVELAATSGAVATPAKPRARNPKENVSRILSRSRDAKEALQTGLVEMRTRLGVTAPEEEVTFGSEEAIELAAKIAADELAAAMQAVANRRDKTPEESQEDLSNLVAKQKAFLITTQVVKIARIQSVINTCEEMRRESDLTAFPAHSAALKEKLGKFETMPSSEILATFEAAVSAAKENLTEAQTAISAIAEFDQPLASSPRQQKASLADRRKAVDAATDQFLDASITASSNVLPSASLGALELTRSTHETVAEEVTKFHKEARARQATKVARESGSSANRLNEITAKLEKLEKPKNIFGRFFARAKSIFSNSRPDEEVKAELRVELGGIHAANEAWIEEQNGRGKAVRAIAQNFADRVESEPSVVESREVDLRGIERAVDGLNSNAEIRKAVKSRMSAAEREEAQKAEFLKSAKTAIQYNMAMAKAHGEGTALPPADNAIKALSAVHSALSAVPLPGMAMVSAALIGAAKAVYGASKKNMARRVADFAGKDAGLQDEIFEQLSEKLYERFAVKIDGKSPLDELTATGAAKLVVTAVGDMMTRLPNFKLPDGVSVPSVDDKKLKTDPKYRQELSEKYGVSINEEDLKLPRHLHKVAETIERKMYVDFIAGHLADAALRAHSSAERAAEVARGTSFTQANLEASDFVHPQGPTTVRSFIAKAVNARAEVMAAVTEKEEIAAATTTTKSVMAASDDSVTEIFEKQKKAVLAILNPKHLKDDKRTPQEALEDLLSSYAAARHGAEENDKTFDPLAFLKESGIIDTGIKFGFRSKARTEFNDNLKEPLLELFEAYDEKLAADQRAQAVRSGDGVDQSTEARSEVKEEEEEEVEVGEDPSIAAEEGGEEVEDSGISLSDDIDPFAGLDGTRALSEPQAAEKLSGFGTTVGERVNYNPGIGTGEVEDGLTSVAIMAATAARGMATTAASAVSDAIPEQFREFVSGVSDRMSAAMTRAADLAASASESLAGIASQAEELTKLVIDRVGGIEEIEAKAEELAKSVEEAAQKNAVAIAKEVTTQILKLRESTKAAKEANAQYQQERADLLEILLPEDFKDVAGQPLSSTKDVEEALDKWVETYRAKIAEGVDRAELREFVAEKLPIVADNREIMRRVVNLAVLGSNSELALAESREAMSEVLSSVSLGLAPTAAKEAETAKAEVVEIATAAEEEVEVEPAIGFEVDESRDGVDDARSVYSAEAGWPDAEADLKETSEMEETPKTKSALLEHLNKHVGDIITSDSDNVEKLKGGKLKINFGDQEEKHPTYVILVMNKDGTSVTGVELHGGAKTRGFGDNRELFDGKGAIKEKHEETMKTFLAALGEMRRDERSDDRKMSEEVNGVVAGLRNAGAEVDKTGPHAAAVLANRAATIARGGSARDW